jgi:hypothetical protein
MTLGDIRANGVRSLDLYCLGRNCHHRGVIDVSSYSDNVTVPSFGPRMRCERCGIAALMRGLTGMNDLQSAAAEA